MKNKEKFADILMDLLVKNERVAINNGTEIPCTCIDFCCNDCLRGIDGCDGEILREWLEAEYVPKVDWSKVPVDTKVYVRNREEDEWKPRYFSEFKDGKVYVWITGTTSFTVNSMGSGKISYIYVKLAEEEENETD